MPRKLIKRFTPDHQVIREHRHLQFFGKLLHDPNLWHLNRRSAAGAFAVGLFVAFLPVPFQMIIAAGGAILFRVNLPVSVALVWVTNPLTMAPMFYFAYSVGAWVLGIHPEPTVFEISMDWLLHELGAIWEPLVVGSLLCGGASAALGYGLIRGLWRWHVIRHLQRRQRRGRGAVDTRKRLASVAHSEQSTPS